MTEQLPLVVARRNPPSLEDFVVGSNAAALDALGGERGALFLAGPAGVGKSHLLRARARARPGALCLSGLSLAETPQILDGAEAASWLGIDDVDCLGGKDEAATALLRVIDARAATGLPIVISSRHEPAALADLLRDLRTRLTQCALYRLRPLDEQALRDWLRQRAEQRGLTLADAAVDWMLRHLRRDPGALEVALERLDIAALAAKRGRVSAPFARSVLGDAL